MVLKAVGSTIHSRGHHTFLAKNSWYVTEESMFCCQISTQGRKERLQETLSFSQGRLRDGFISDNGGRGTDSFKTCESGSPDVSCVDLIKSKVEMRCIIVGA